MVFFPNWWVLLVSHWISSIVEQAVNRKNWLWNIMKHFQRAAHTHTKLYILDVSEKKISPRILPSPPPPSRLFSHSFSSRLHIKACWMSRKRNCSFSLTPLFYYSRHVFIVFTCELWADGRTHFVAVFISVEACNCEHYFPRSWTCMCKW
jgi:hypothetical protein